MPDELQSGNPPPRKFHPANPYFEANIQGLKVRVHFSMDHCLWCWMTYKDAQWLDVPPGTLHLTSHPKQNVEWVKKHTARGPEQDRIIEQCYHWDFAGWLRQHQEAQIRDAEKREQQEQIIAYDIKKQLEEQQEQEWNLPDDLSSGN